MQSLQCLQGEEIGGKNVMNTQDLSAGDVPRALLRRRELCKLLGVGAATIYRWLRNGSFPHPSGSGPAGLLGGLRMWRNGWLIDRQRNARSSSNG